MEPDNDAVGTAGRKIPCLLEGRHVVAPTDEIQRRALLAMVNEAALLLAVGDKDGASDWHQDIEMYSLARRAGKQCVMLVYPGENHSLAVKANQIDYHDRILEWFGHYLQGGKAAEWIDKGVTVVDREKELKKFRKDEGAK